MEKNLNNTAKNGDVALTTPFFKSTTLKATLLGCFWAMRGRLLPAKIARAIFDSQEVKQGG